MTGAAVARAAREGHAQHAAKAKAEAQAQAVRDATHVRRLQAQAWAEAHDREIMEMAKGKKGVGKHALQTLAHNKGKTGNTFSESGSGSKLSESKPSSTKDDSDS